MHWQGRPGKTPLSYRPSLSTNLRARNSWVMVKYHLANNIFANVTNRTVMNKAKYWKYPLTICRHICQTNISPGPYKVESWTSTSLFGTKTSKFTVHSILRTKENYCGRVFRIKCKIPVSSPLKWKLLKLLPTTLKCWQRNCFKHFWERFFIQQQCWSHGPISRMSVEAIQPKCICKRDNLNQALLRAKNHTRSRIA